MHRDSGTGLRVFGVVCPRIRAAFADDVGRFQWDRRIAAPVETFRPSQADTQAPRLAIILCGTLNQEQDGVMGRLRSGRSSGWLFGLRRLRV